LYLMLFPGQMNVCMMTASFEAVSSDEDLE
jgi:hypothetical protein